MFKKMLTVAIVVVGIGVLGVSSCFAQAQGDADKAEGKTIFSYKKELNMTDQQEKDLHTALDGFQKYFEGKKDALAKIEKEISELIGSKGELKTIKARIDELAKLKAEVTYKDIETSRQVENILKPEQIEQWKKIQTEVIETMRRQMMEQQAAAQAQVQTPAPAEAK